ncbi:MAG: YicC/YloC family endoribonuclease [Candidatus Omnitrophota bacterium]
MLNSMTGFGSKECEPSLFGKISVELKSANHKFLEVVFHLPEGFLSLEDKLKKKIDSRIKRGRIICAVSVLSKGPSAVYINKPLLKNYILALRGVKKELRIDDEISMDMLVHLPGVLSLGENRFPRERLWAHLNILMDDALDELVKTRRKEGSALQGILKAKAEALSFNLGLVKKRFQKVIKEKTAFFQTDEERSAFLKTSDITEEIERLGFHIRNFKHKLSSTGAVGKELDFIAQEMQREANTAAAKSCDAHISSLVVQMKSLIEKIREQAQNIE